MKKFESMLKYKVIGVFMVFCGTFFISMSASAADLVLKNPLKTTNIQVFIGQIIKAGLGIVGSLALVMFMYGGLTWMLSAGDAGMVEKGKKTFVWSTLGILMIFGSYALVRFVFEVFQ